MDRRQIIRKGENIYWIKNDEGRAIAAEADVDLLATWSGDTVDVRPLYPMKAGETAITIKGSDANGNAIALGMRTMIRNDPVFPDALRDFAALADHPEEGAWGKRDKPVKVPATHWFDGERWVVRDQPVTGSPR